MKASDELNRFAGGFLQGSSSEFSTAQDWIESALRRLDDVQKRALKKYLDDLLSGNPDDAALQRIWSDTPADYYMTANGSVRGFFKMIGETIGKQLYL